MNEPLLIPTSPSTSLTPTNSGWIVRTTVPRFFKEVYFVPKPNGQVSDEIEIALREYDCLEKRNSDVKRMGILAFRQLL